MPISFRSFLNALEAILETLIELCGLENNKDKSSQINVVVHEKVCLQGISRQFVRYKVEKLREKTMLI